MNPLSLGIALLIIVPALALAAQRSSWLLDYLIVVMAFNRGLRRVVDYYNGAFDSLSPISLTPLVVGGLAALVVLNQMQGAKRQIGNTTFKVLRWYTIACIPALIIGVVNNRLGAIYDLGNYLAPLGMMGYGAMYAKSPPIVRRWAISTTVCGMLVAAYGLYQFYTIPAWDAFWVRSVGFEGYLGQLEPTKMTLFSTLSERGTAAMFLAGGLILLLLRPGLLGPLRWPAAGLVVTAMLLTYVRTTVLHVGIACAALPVVTKGRGLVGMALLALVFAFFGESLLGFLPGSNQIADRYATLGNIQNEGSFQGRTRLIGIAFRHALTEPLGVGMGSHGLGGRLSGGGQAGVADSSGFLEILRTFGWIGAGLIVALLRQLWKSSTYVWRRVPGDRDASLFRAWFVSGMVILFSGNWLAGISYFWVLAGYVLGREDHLRAAALQPRFAPRPPLHAPLSTGH